MLTKVGSKSLRKRAISRVLPTPLSRSTKDQVGYGGDRLRPARARPEQKMRRLDTEHVEGEVGFGALGHQPHPVAHGDVLQSRVDVEGTLVRGGYSLCGRWTSTQTSRWSLEGKGQVPVRVDSGSLETGQKTAESRMRRLLLGRT